MHIRTRLLETFVGISLFGVVLVGLVTYDYSVEVHARSERLLLASLSEHIIAMLEADSSLSGDSETIISRLPGLSIANLEVFLKDRAGGLYATDGGEVRHDDVLTLKFVRDLIGEGAGNNGHIHKEGSGYSWLEAEIPDSAYSLVLVRKTSNYTPFRKFFREFGIPLLVTALVVLWVSVWAGLITASLFRRVEAQKAALQQQTSELEQANERALSASSAKSKFLSNMSHELRTPLNAILGFGQLLQQDTLQEQQQENVKEIMSAGNHLLELINEVLDLAKIEAGKLELSLHDLELKDVLSECLSLIQPSLESQQLTLVDNTASFHVMADHTRLKQVLLNLLSNAVKYNREGGSITLECRAADNNRLRISVSDTGYGLTEQQLEKLFQSFERMGAEATSVVGTGIGLVISKGLMELMGGSIGATSVPGEGSTFWIEINLACQDLKPGPENSAVAADKTALGRIDGSGRTVLYIEDNPASLRLVSKLLKGLSSVHLITAQEPLPGLELAQLKQPDLILLDINLPGLNGYELLARLKSTDCTREIPVVAVSANAMPGDLEKASGLAFSDYITKPIDVPNFLAVIERNLPYKPADTRAKRIS